MKSLKMRIEKMEEEVNPPRFIKLNIISHIPGLSSQTMLIPVKKKKR